MLIPYISIVVASSTIIFFAELYKCATSKRRARRTEERRQAIRNQLHAQPFQECVARLFAIKERAALDGIPTAYVLQLAALITYANSTTSDKRSIIQSINSLRASMSFDGVLTPEMDQDLCEAAGTLA